MKRLAGGADNGKIFFVDIMNEKVKEAFKLRAHNGYIFSMQSLVSKNVILSGADDTVKAWEVNFDGAHLLFKCRFQENIVKSIAVFEEKDIFISNHNNSIIKVWNLTTGRALKLHSDKNFG